MQVLFCIQIVDKCKCFDRSVRIEGSVMSHDSFLDNITALLRSVLSKYKYPFTLLVEIFM